MKIVILEADSLGEDMVFTPFEALGEVVIYRTTTADEMEAKTLDADVIVANKVPICEETIGKAKNLKLVCLTATGFNNLDGDYLKKRGIAAYNVAGYSTNGVAQHTFALLFYVLEKLNYYDNYVKSGEYSRGSCFSHFAQNFFELDGKTWGIIGMGTIGRRVADIAGLFGCHVIYYSTTGKNQQKDYERADWDTLLTKSDIISVHAPLTDATLGLINAEAFAKMKRSAIFINVGRGPIVVEQDLYEALENGEIAAAGLDVLKEEPMSKENPLAKIKDSNKLLITPHIAWASVEARTRLMKIIEEQIKEFFHL